jgi:hypothetical protein
MERSGAQRIWVIAPEQLYQSKFLFVLKFGSKALVLNTNDTDLHTPLDFRAEGKNLVGDQPQSKLITTFSYSI